LKRPYSGAPLGKLARGSSDETIGLDDLDLNTLEINGFFKGETIGLDDLETVLDLDVFEALFGVFTTLTGLGYFLGRPLFLFTTLTGLGYFLGRPLPLFVTFAFDILKNKIKLFFYFLFLNFIFFCFFKINLEFSFLYFKIKLDYDLDLEESND